MSYISNVKAGNSYVYKPMGHTSTTAEIQSKRIKHDDTTADKTAKTDTLTTTGTTGGMKIQTGKTDGVELSDTAKSYLSDLKKKYGNVDFIVADFTTDEEADKILGKGTGEYNCVITPETLEKMATDKAYAKQYEDVIAAAGGQFDEIKQELGDKAEQIESLGISVDSTGKVNYYALIRDSLKTSDAPKLNADKTDEKAEKAGKADEKDKTAKATDKNSQLVTAGTLKELLAKLKEATADKNDTEKTADKATDKPADKAATVKASYSYSSVSVTTEHTEFSYNA